MKKAVVCGATSMIGVATVKECILQGDFVYAVVRKGSQNLSRLPQSENIRIIECDLCELEKLTMLIEERCNVFYHFAWEQSGQNRNDNMSIQCRNIEYTLDAVRIAQILGCTRFIGAGSQAEYGMLGTNINEDMAVDPQEPYGICKYTAGKLSAKLCKRLDIEHIWARIFSVYGPNDRPTSMIYDTINRLKNGEEMTINAPNRQWDYLSADDAGRAFYLLSEKGIADTVYNIASGESRTVKEFAEVIAEKLGRGYLLKFGDEDLPDLTADITRLKTDTGFTVQSVFEEEIKKII